MVYSVEQILRKIGYERPFNPRSVMGVTPRCTGNDPSYQRLMDQQFDEWYRERLDRLTHPEKYLSRNQLGEYRRLQKERESLVQQIRVGIEQVCSPHATSLEDLDKKIAKLDRIILHSGQS